MRWRRRRSPARRTGLDRPDQGRGGSGAGCAPLRATGRRLRPTESVAVPKGALTVGSSTPVISEPLRARSARPLKVAHADRGSGCSLDFLRTPVLSTGKRAGRSAVLDRWGALGRVGARVGLTSMTIGSDLDGTVDRRVGLSAGAFTTVELPGPFALQPELLYVQKGAVLNTPRVLQNGTLVGVERSVDASYLELVPLGKLRVPGVPLVTPTVGVGPTIGVRLSSALDVRVIDQFGREQQVDSPPELDAQSTEAGLLVSVEVSAEVGGVAASVTGRYRLGLTGGTDGGRSSEQQGLDLGRNRGFLVTAGVAF